MPRKNIAILFGGKSAEHQVSLLSAVNVMAALSKQKYNIFPIGIDVQGNFLSFSSSKKCIDFSNDPKKIRLAKNGSPITFIFGDSKRIYHLDKKKIGEKIDVVFPVLHGTFGEDGRVQGLLEMFNVPYVGADVLGSSIGMDKDVSKRLWQEAGLQVAKFVALQKSNKSKESFNSIKKKLGAPFFVKPASAGSSVGVHKVQTKKEFNRAEKDAFRFDNKIICEEVINGREIECSIVGNDKLTASFPGEIIPEHDFYSYEAKYLDKDGAKLITPAKLSKKTINQIQKISIKAFCVLECRGMARVDGFLQKNGKFILNEINTIPGFTNISMYPKLWGASGISYSKLLDKLIQLAINKYKTSDIKIKH